MSAFYCQGCGVRVTEVTRAGLEEMMFCSDECRYIEQTDDPPVEISPGAFLLELPWHECDDEDNSRDAAPSAPSTAESGGEALVATEIAPRRFD